MRKKNDDGEKTVGLERERERKKEKRVESLQKFHLNTQEKAALVKTLFLASTNHSISLLCKLL